MQLKILEENFDRLKSFFEKDDTDAPQLYRTSQLLDSQSPTFVQVREGSTLPYIFLEEQFRDTAFASVIPLRTEIVRMKTMTDHIPTYMYSMAV